MQLHAVVIALTFVACTKDSATTSSTSTGSARSVGSGGSAAIAPKKVPPPPPPPQNDRRVRVPPNPPAVASIAYVCSHSDTPFGNGSQLSISVYDLDRATWTRDRADTPSTKDDHIAPTKRDHAAGTIGVTKLQLLRAAVAKVLAGGPYEPEYPMPEGISCHVTLAGATGDPFFQIDKANRELKDAVNDLLNAL